jgi:F-type H+-transporting ATPase subunit epsilon
MNLIVLTPDKQLYQGEVSRITVPGVQGEFEVLENHAPIVSSLASGTVNITTDNKDTQAWDINSGFIEVLDNKVSLLVQEQ